MESGERNKLKRDFYGMGRMFLRGTVEDGRGVDRRDQCMMDECTGHHRESH